MTIDEFKRTKFSAKDMVRYGGKWYEVYSVDFDENLVAFGEDEDYKRWVRCESIEAYVSYSDKHKNKIILQSIDEQIKELQNKKKTIVKDLLKKTEARLREVGLKYADDVEVIENGCKRRCTYGGLHTSDKHYLYLEFIYEREERTYIKNERYVQTMNYNIVDVTKDIKVIIKGKKYDYNELVVF